MPLSFIDSPFTTRVEYNAWIAAGAPEDLLKPAAATVPVLLRGTATVVMVTGASGWVGGHVCHELVAKGYTVRAAVRDPASTSVAFLQHMGCHLVRIPDLLSDEGWAAALDGCAGLIHVASPVDLTGNANEAELVRMAVEGSERALRFAAEAGTVKRVVVTATMASVCGSQRNADPDHLWCEADKNDAPGSPYSKSKTEAEAKVWELATLYKDKYEVSTVHPAVVLGTLLPGQRVTSTMTLLQSILSGKVATYTYTCMLIYKCIT